MKRGKGYFEWEQHLRSFGPMEALKTTIKSGGDLGFFKYILKTS